MASSPSSSSSLRSSCSFPNLLLWLLNLSLLALAAAALAPALLLRPRPTPFGWALLSVHAATLLSALASMYDHLARRRLCCHAHAALAVTALCGHALASYALLLRRDRSLALLASARDRREQVALVLLESALLLAMFLVQAVALAAACAVGRRWAREHEAAEAAAARKRGRKMARVRAGVAPVDEEKGTSGKVMLPGRAARGRVLNERRCRLGEGSDRCGCVFSRALVHFYLAFFARREEFG